MATLVNRIESLWKALWLDKRCSLISTLADSVHYLIEINFYRKGIKTRNIVGLWWTLSSPYTQYFDIKVQTKDTLFSSKILWSKLPVISFCLDLLDNLYLYSINHWYALVFVKSTKVTYRGKSHYLTERGVS